MISSIRKVRRKLSIRRMTNVIQPVVVVSLRTSGEIQTLKNQGVRVTCGSGIKVYGTARGGFHRVLWTLALSVQRELDRSMAKAMQEII